MTIIDIKQTEKIKVLLRLLDDKESLEIACSKSGLDVKVVKSFLQLGLSQK